MGAEGAGSPGKGRAATDCAVAPCLALAGLLLYACAPPTVTPTAATLALPTSIAVAGAPMGGAALGREAFAAYDCGRCHTIPGVPVADGTSAPSLAGYRANPTILGQVPNTLQNTARYIERPQQVLPSTTMPDQNVPADAAPNMAACLGTLG